MPYIFRTGVVSQIGLVSRDQITAFDITIKVLPALTLPT